MKEMEKNFGINNIHWNSCCNITLWAIMVVCSFVSSQAVKAQTDSLKLMKLNTDFSRNFKENFKDNRSGGFKGSFDESFMEQQNGKGELKLNEEAIKMITFDFMPNTNESNKPLEAPLEKSWMKFKQDLDVPVSLMDTTRVRKPEGYIRMLPYSIWTKFGEDPVYDVMVFGKQKEYKITWTLNPFREYSENYGLSIPPSAGMISDGIMMKGLGLTIRNLDFIGFIYDNFTKRGRMLKHNQKHATAWKNYIGYQPTLSDSLKFPTFYNGLTGPVFVYNSKDSMHIASPAPSFEELPDSVKAEIEVVIATKRDSLRTEYLEKANEEADKERKSKRVKRSRKVKEARTARKDKERKEKLKEKEEKMLEELPGSMDDLYEYMRKKEARESEEREKKKKEKELEI